MGDRFSLKTTARVCCAIVAAAMFFQVTGTACAVENVNMPSEPNDTLEQANPITVNTDVTDTFESANDRDCYEFSISKPGTVTLQYSTYVYNYDPSWSVGMTLYQGPAKAPSQILDYSYQRIVSGSGMSISSSGTDSGHLERPGDYYVCLTGSPESPLTHTLNVQYSADTYDVEYFPNNGESSSSQKLTYGDLATAPADPTREGYTFRGWYTAAEGGEKWDFSKPVTSSMTLFAHWSPNAYTVSFDANGGKVSVSSKKVLYDAAYGELPSASRVGYSFQGWFTAKDGGSQVGPATTMGAANTTVYAHWAIRSYTMAFDSNGGSAVASQSVKYGSKAAQPANPTRTGYTFRDWYTAKNGGVKYDFSKTVTGDVVLYAHWSVNSYTLAFDGNSGKTSEASRVVQYGGQYGTLPTATRTGYTFQGWYTAKDGGVKATSTTTMGAANATLYAHWTINTYTLAFDGNGGSVSPQSRGVAYGEKYGELPTATRSGYSFLGWYTARSDGEQVTKDNVMGATDTTVYAHWKVSITFRDVSSSTPHSADIAWTAASGISTGWIEPDGTRTFRGMDTVKRQDMAAFLRREAVRMGISDAAAWKPSAGDWAKFRDVDRSTPHAEDILWLAHSGIAQGYSDGTFRGMTSVYRQDMAAFLHRLASKGGKGKDVEPRGFRDVTDSTPHADDIRWLGGSGVSTGYPDGSFGGMVSVYRQDMAAFLHRLDSLS